VRRAVGRQLLRAQHLCPTKDGVQGRSEFVRDRGEELILELIGLLRFQEQQAHFQHVVHAREHLGEIERLADEIFRAGAQSAQFVVREDRRCRLSRSFRPSITSSRSCPASEDRGGSGMNSALQLADGRGRGDVTDV
jgi:hypothetical protein